MSPEPLLQVDYVARAHGLSGELGVRTFDPASQALLDVDRLVLRLKDGTQAEWEVDSIRPAQKELLLGLAGVTDRSAAERLVGATVLVFREDLHAPEAGEYFQGDLVGLEAVDEEGRSLGKVEEVWSSGPVPNLVIRGPGREELLVPFAEAFVPSVDVAGGRLTVRPPEYLE